MPAPTRFGGIIVRFLRNGRSSMVRHLPLNVHDSLRIAAMPLDRTLSAIRFHIVSLSRAIAAVG
ncbi:MAG TPA: hypothetical protein DEP05_02970 [Betaproteobacteria bacterium]|nr:hypothetical protein [Betaproteobacteria bacterium]